MRKGSGYPVVGPVLVVLLVSASALLGHGSGPGPSVPACAGGGCESRAVDAFNFFSVASGNGAAQDAELASPVEQRRVTIEVKVKGANGIVSRGRHVITVVP